MKKRIAQSGTFAFGKNKHKKIEDEGSVWKVHRIEGYTKHKQSKIVNKNKLMYRKNP